VANGADNNGSATEAGTPFSDSGGHTWQVAVPVNDGSTISTRFTQRYAPNITGQSSHTVTYTSPGTNFPAIAVSEVDEADTSLPEDQEASHATGSGTNPRSSGTTGATIDAEEIAIAGLTHGSGGSE